jgi:large subunit ribosomal protein L10e
MRLAFGKPSGLAARINNGSVILELKIMSANKDAAVDAMKSAATKLPVPTKMLVLQNQVAKAL